MSLTACRVALIGRRLDHNENLGLGYLRAALIQKNAQVDVHYVNDAAELERAVEAVLATNPRVVGLSLADGGSAMLPLAVGEALTRAGYRGHVTAGGQFATLARDWLLARYAWLDSVVRFAGERPLVEIAERVQAGASVGGIPGVTTRSGDGEPAPVLDPSPFSLRPARDELPRVLGHAAAHMAASRGCLGRCQYCGPAALHTLERQEGIRAGISSRSLNLAGVGGARHRELDAVLDEMAELWHERGVRYFYFVDEHLLPYAEPEALAYLRAWKRGLDRRRVGPLGIGTMLRADRITPAIARAFSDVGLVRVFVGLELATEEEGRRFGRRVPGPAELELLSEFARNGVVTVSNLMLLNPYSTPETIRAGIDLLERIPHGVFEATRMMVYHGTRLMRTMREEGRLIGNPLRYGYTFDDPAMERFAEIFTRLRGDAFWNYSVAFRTHDAFLALSLARRLHPERASERLERRLDVVRRAVNRLYAGAYRRALTLALDGAGYGDAGDLVRELRPRVAALEVELDAVESALHRAGATAERPFAPMRAAAAGVVSFALAACGGETRHAEPPRPTPPPLADASPAPLPVEADPALGEVVVPDAGAEAASPGPTCSASEAETAEQAVRSSLTDGAACFSGVVELSDPVTVVARSSSPPRGPGYHFCSPIDETHFETEAKVALAGRVHACNDEDGRPVRVVIEGNAQRQADQLSKKIDGCAGSSWNQTGRVQIVLNKTGKVTRVSASPATPFTRCIQKVLVGLSFPCLSSFDVCPEHVIIE
jgi:radical SAM superfamily enzyme YgiQ (UPF0313 family)